VETVAAVAAEAARPFAAALGRILLAMRDISSDWTGGSCVDWERCRLRQ
jgi:hypothetical protein